ncbi:MAG TPA: acyltransferase [Allosphingosinicella sp.]|jgi:peptidoglycan/LPS O-acetylase OafA/YrhL
MRRHQPYYPAMDWLRLACAVAVLLFHFGWTSAGGGEVALLVGPGIAVPGRDWLWRHGSVGVPIFFVISGFVIAGSAADGGPMRFLRRRIERLYPAIFVCAPLSALLWWGAGRPPGEGLILLAKSILLVPVGRWVDPPYWTLGVEIGFYAYVFLLLVAGGARWLRPGAVALALASSALWAFFLLRGEAVSPPLWLLPLYWGMHFALGALLHFLRDGSLRFRGAACAVAAGAAGVVQTMQLLTPELAGPVPTVLWLVGVAVVGLAPGRASSRDRPISRLAGLATYPLYLLHFGLGLALMASLVRLGLAPLAAMAVAGGVLLAMAVIVAAFAEPAVRSGLRKGLDSIERGWRGRRFGLIGEGGRPLR